MANNLPPPKIAIFERVIWSAGRQKSLSVRSGGAGFDRFRLGARNCPFDTSHLEHRESVRKGRPMTLTTAPAPMMTRQGAPLPLFALPQSSSSRSLVRDSSTTTR
jgi:hypothetical protein